MRVLQHRVSNPFALRQQDGFTLIEMLIALVIISVGLLAMASMSLTVMRTNHQNDIRNGAIRVASDVAEQFYAMPFANLVDGNGTRAMKLRGASDMIYNLVWEVEDQTNDLKQVTLTVQYDVQVSGAVQSQTNTTVLYRHRAM